MIKEEFEPIHPVELLASDYHKDLDFVHNIDLTIVTEEVDVSKLQILCDKYVIEGEVTKENYTKKIGELSAEILDRFENLAIVHVLERERLLKPNKMPHGEVKEKEPVPEVLKEKVI